MVGLSGLDAMSTFFEKKASLREASGGNINSFFLKDGETKIFRFVGNDVKTVKFHNFVTCRDGKPRSFICPNQGEDGLYDESGPCLICKYVPKMKDGKKTKNYPTDRGIAATWSAADHSLSDRFVAVAASLIAGRPKDGKGKQQNEDCIAISGQWGQTGDE